MNRSMLAIPLLLASVLIANGQLARADAPAPVPDGSAIEVAEKLVKDVYKAEYAKKKPADQLELASKLLKSAEETKEPSAAKFVMLREARDLAARGGDVAMALDAALATSQSFALKLAEIKAAVLEAAEKAKIAPARSIAEAALESLDDAIRADDYPNADRILKVALSSASRANVAVMSASIAQRGKEIDAIRKAFDSLEPVRKALAANPTDPAASAKFGRFLCLLKGDWEAGLPLLAQGDDERLKAAAVLDLKETTAAGRAAVADRWLEVVEKIELVERVETRVRAYHSYLVAANELVGLDKSRVEKRIADLEKLEPKIARAHALWTVIFRSADPTLWNTNANRSRDQFAISLDKVPAGIKYLKMTSPTAAKPNFAIIEMTKDRLGKQSDEDGYGWVGKNPRSVKVQNLGIYDTAWRDFPRGAIHVFRGNDWCRGWGFGTIYAMDDDQGFTWAGVPIGKSVLEIAVKASSLSIDERKQLLKKKK